MEDRKTHRGGPAAPARTWRLAAALRRDQGPGLEGRQVVVHVAARRLHPLPPGPTPLSRADPSTESVMTRRSFGELHMAGISSMTPVRQPPSVRPAPAGRRAALNPPASFKGMGRPRELTSAVLSATGRVVDARVASAVASASGGWLAPLACGGAGQPSLGSSEDAGADKPLLCRPRDALKAATASRAVASS